MKESIWYMFLYFVLIHLCGLGLGMFLQDKITKYSMLKKFMEEPSLTKEKAREVVEWFAKMMKETKQGKI